MDKGKQWKEGTGKISLFEFLDIAACHYIHVYLLPYLQLEAFVKVSGHAKELIGEVPDHTTGGGE